MSVKPRFACVALLTLAVLVNVPHAAAQYLFLDADGDGVNSGFSEWPPITDTTTVDVYVVTNRNADGSPAACDPSAGPLDLWYYTLNILSQGAPFAVVGIENQIPGMTELFPPFTNAYGVTVGYSTNNPLPPGTHLLLRLKVMFVWGNYCPTMTIVSSSCYSLPNVGTEIGSSCAGIFPVEGLGFGYCTDSVNRRPTVTAPAEVAGTEGEAISFPITVTDPDCGDWYLFSFYAMDLPQGSSVTGLSPFTYGQTTATFSWTPLVGQAGDYSVLFVAHDPDTWNWWIPPDVADTTHITVGPASPLSADQAPAAHAGGPYAGLANVPVEFHGSASYDSDSGALQYFWTFGDSEVGAGETVEHAFATAGVYGVTLTVTDSDGLTGEDHATATITASPPGAASLIALVAPNPMTGSSVMEFTTTRGGFAYVLLFDVRGRLVARPFEAAALGAGSHRVPMINAAGGATLASGIYFLQLVTEHDGRETRRITVLR
jgi:hypothetical protein